MKKNMSRRDFLKAGGVGVAGAALLGVAGCGQSGGGGQQGGSFKPSRRITMIVPGSSGGGWDTTARAAQQVLDKTGTIDQNIAVQNKPGGGGAVGWSYVHGKSGDPYTMFVSSPPIILVPLNGESDYGYKDFTPIANLFSTAGAYVVRADAKWKNFKDLAPDAQGEAQIGLGGGRLRSGEPGSGGVHSGREGRRGGP